VIKHLVARFRQIHKQLSDLLRQRQGNTQSGRGFQRGVEILNLVFDDTAGGEVSLDHPLPVQFKNTTLAETSQDCFADFRRVRSAGISEQEAFRDRTDCHCNNALVDELAKLTSPMRTNVRHVSQRGENRTLVPGDGGDKDKAGYRAGDSCARRPRTCSNDGSNKPGYRLTIRLTPSELRASPIFWKMTAPLKPLSESPVMPTVGPRNSMTDVVRKCYWKIWNGSDISKRPQAFQAIFHTAIANFANNVISKYHSRWSPESVRARIGR
jgi:hypothetical protein